jgi:hypothetical protein
MGTLISTMFIGIALYGLSRTGLVMADLEFSECLTFGALISATDPVSTLAVFSELQVRAHIYIYIYPTLSFSLSHTHTSYDYYLLDGTKKCDARFLRYLNTLN